MLTDEFFYKLMAKVILYPLLDTSITINLWLTIWRVVRSWEGVLLILDKTYYLSFTSCFFSKTANTFMNYLIALE